MFDPTQVRLLQAMGYPLWQRVQPGVATRGIAAPTVEPAPLASPPMTSAASQTTCPADRLWAALLAAAGLSPQRAEQQRMRRASSGISFEYLADELWIDPQAMLGNPGAKRALWKTLRALRRAERGRGG
jgi:hypothetical protein